MNMLFRYMVTYLIVFVVLKLVNAPLWAAIGFGMVAGLVLVCTGELMRAFREQKPSAISQPEHDTH